MYASQNATALAVTPDIMILMTVSTVFSIPRICANGWRDQAPKWADMLPNSRGPACQSVGNRTFASGIALALVWHLQGNSKLVRLHGGRPNRTAELCSNFRTWLLLRHVFQLCDVIRCPATKCRIGHW